MRPKVCFKLPNLYLTNLLHTNQKKKESPASTDVSFWQDRGVVENDFSSSYPVFSASKGSEVFVLDAMARKGSTHGFSVVCKAQKTRQPVTEGVSVCRAINAAQ